MKSDVLLETINSTSFRETVFEKKIARCGTLSLEAINSICSVDSIDQLLNAAHQKWSSLNFLVKDYDRPHSSPAEIPVTGSTGKQGALIDSERFVAAINEGHTGVIYSIQRGLGTVASYCHEIEARLRCHVDANAYISNSTSRGASLHMDAHDVIVMQIIGTKKWKIYDAPRHLPLFSSTIDNPKEVDELVLNPGESIYIPRGVPHATQSTNDKSVHLTFACSPTNRGIDIVGRAVQEAAYRLDAFRETWNNRSDVEVRKAYNEMLSLLADIDPCELIEKTLHSQNTKSFKLFE